MSSIARVSINGVEVGSVPAETYFDILASVRRDPRLYLAQVVNLIGGACRLFLRALLIQPIAWFVGIAALVMLAPESAAAFLELLRSAGAEQVIQVCAGVLKWSFAFGFVGALVEVQFTDEPLSLRNVFDVSVHDRLRQILEVPTAGFMSVTVVLPKGDASPA